MASAVDICNLGLSHIGARAQISAISPPDGSVEAGYCARFYPIARREMLEAKPWAFATKRASLATVTNTSSVWAYAYALPSDCIKPLRVLRLYLIDSLIAQYDIYQDTYPDILIETAFSERDSAVYEIEGNVLRTNEPEAVLIYTREISDTNAFPPMFVSALGMLMASYLAGPIIKGMDGATVGARWRQAAMAAADTAAASNSNASSKDRNEFLPAHLAVRR